MRLFRKDRYPEDGERYERDVPEGLVFEIDVLKRQFVNIVRVNAGRYVPVKSNFYVAMPEAKVEEHFDYLASHFGYYEPTPSPMPEDDS